jgi:hypothetical protein
MSSATVTITEPAILFTLNQLYRPGMSSEELYEATRGTWRLGPKREQARYGIAVYQGIVLEVYRIRRWHPAGTLPYRFRRPETLNLDRRWEFEGEVAEDLHARYVGRSVGKGGQNPVRYSLRSR